MFYAALRGEWRGHIRDRSILSKYITMSKHKQILFINKSWSSLQRPRSTRNTSTLQMMQTCYQWAMTAAQMGLLCTIYWIPMWVFYMCRVFPQLQHLVRPSGLNTHLTSIMLHFAALWLLASYFTLLWLLMLNKQLKLVLD